MPTINEVQDISPIIRYTGTPGQTAYVYPFPIFDERDVIVNIDDVDLTLNVDYTVTGVTDNNGGNIILMVATVGGEDILIYRDTPIDRLTDYVENGDFLAETVNNDFDRIILMLQELADGANGTNRAIRVGVTDPTLSSDLIIGQPEVRANLYLGYDSTGKVVEKAIVASEGLTISEAQILADGQTTVIFSNITSDASFYLCGINADSGRLCNPEDYSVAGTNTIELVSSYPAGMVVLGVLNDTSVNPSLGVTSFNARNGVVNPEALDYTPAFIGAATAAQGALADTALQNGDNVSELVNDANYLQNGDNVSDLVNDANYATIFDDANNQTGTAYTLVVGDEGKTVWMKNAAANVLTIPLNATQALPIDTVIMIMMEDIGVTSITAVAGVLLNTIDAGTGDLTQFAGVTLVQRSIDVWIATPLVVA